MAFDPAAASAAIMAALSPADLAKAKAYTTGGQWLILWNFLVGVVVAVVIIRAGWLHRLRERLERRRPRPVLTSFLVATFYLLVSVLLTLPWSFYSEWWRERSYGHSSQPLGDWIGQALLSIVIFALIGGLFFMALYWLIRRAPRTWWLWGAGLAAGAVAFLLLLAPVAIEPLFNRFTPLPEGPVKAALTQLKAQAGIPDARLVMYDGSRQSNNFTANVSGIAGSARIAISDVALKQASLAEVRAVTGHEIGHYVLGHVGRSVALLSVLALVGFFLAHRLFPAASALLGARQVRGIADPAGLPILLVIVSTFLLLAMPLMNWNTRAGEAEADNYSLDLVKEPDGLATALVKTAEYRDPYPTRLQEMLFYTHPSVSWRVRNAMEHKGRQLR